jgi:TolA-binding protein
VNLALMSTAIALYNEKEYDSALLLYRMVLSREELVAYQMVKMNDIRQDEGMPDVDLQIVTNVSGRVETLFGNKYIDIVDQATAPNGSAAMAVKPMALVELEEAVGALVALPPYEDDVLYRIGQLYASVGRPWEAATVLEAVAKRDPDGDRGQRAFYEFLQVLTDPLEEYGRVETIGKQFLEIYKEGVGPRQVAHALTSAYQKQARWKEIKQLLPWIEGFVPSQDENVRKFECELYYMQAIADLILLNYPEAEIGFANVLKNFPGSHQEDNVTYWHAMSLLFLQDYEAALEEFELYSFSFSKGLWVAEASFRAGICLFGLERNDKAEERFGFVIKNYPNSAVYPDACSLRGDLLAAKGLLNEAQLDYEEAIAKARNPRQAGYATFQLVAMFELESRYDEIIHGVNAYLERYGEEADVAKAAYWIGKTKLAQGLTGEAVTAYLEAIIQYGGNVRQDGVDLIINELVSVSRRRLVAEEVVELKTSLRAAEDAAENKTLRLRLRVLLANLDGTELELGNALIVELADLSQAPPPVLAVICEASFEAEDYSRAKEILEIFLNRFEDSDFMRSAYKLRGYDLYLAEDLEGAMKLVKDAQALYGTDPDAVWAQLMKGQIELKRDDFEAARETFRAVITVRDWRGPAYAEANYTLGAVEEKAGDPRKAFAWYQRTYFQYKGYNGGQWAADAYLASARCLRALGLEDERRNTFRAMLFDKYVNTLPQADEARVALGAPEVLEIEQMIATGGTTNITVSLDAEGTE